MSATQLKVNSVAVAISKNKEMLNVTIRRFSMLLLDNLEVAKAPSHEQVHYKRDRTFNLHGGVCVYISDTLISHEVTHLELNNDSEQVWCSVNLETEKILVGDFNLDHTTWHNNTAITTNSLAEDFIETFDSNHLTQHVNFYTFQLNSILGPSSTLDLILTESSQHIFSLERHSQLGCTKKGRAHLILTWNFAVKSSNPPRNRFSSSRQDFENGNFNKLNMYFKDIDWVNRFQHLNINECYNVFQSIYIEGCNLQIPAIKSNYSALHTPWITKEVISAMKNKKKLYYRSKNPNWRLDTKRYKNRCNKVKQTLTHSIAQYEKSISEKAKTNPKLIYRYINMKLKVKNQIRSMKESNGNITSNESHIATILNNYFSSVFTPLNSSLSLPTFEKRIFSVIDETSVLNRLNENYIQVLLSNINLHKPAGIDGIHPHVLNKCSSSLNVPITYIFIKSICEGRVPATWLEANITPLHKKGSKLGASNYRPISLTSACCKILERIVKDCLTEYLSANNLLSQNQHGFVPKKSCITNLLETVDQISHSMAKG
ncbi:uncharacterized protein LOC136092020 [Hydra vulgaris]|uniref:Uncharacterized protein LOC136092020 n=1 Tax=Hydra vulgaris TaxID=6087 RepID=A0ABM4DML6_HYDVU